VSPRPGISDVFINCPFDVTYKPTFDAIVFAVYDLGFKARCALEVDDGAEYRLAKIERIIEECQFGIHDLSSVALDVNTGLPRLNMPLELRLFLGCKRFGAEHHSRKSCLILDSEPYRYRQFISDISGQDIHFHGGEPNRAIIEVRNWLCGASERKALPGGEHEIERYRRFLGKLPKTCAEAHLRPQSLTFLDLWRMIQRWLPRSG
jgi:hypothetical protein